MHAVVFLYQVINLIFSAFKMYCFIHVFVLKYYMYCTLYFKGAF